MKNPSLVVIIGAMMALAVDHALAQERHVLSEELGLFLAPAFSPDGKLLATLRSVRAGTDPVMPAPAPGGSWRSKIVLWDVDSRQVVRTLYGQAHGAGRCLTFSPDGKTLALAESHGRVRLWNTATWQESTLEVPPSVPDKKPGRATSRFPVCGEMAFSADSRSLAVCYDSGPSAANSVVRLWDHSSYAVEGVLDTEGRPQHVSFLPNARLAVVVFIRGNRKVNGELQIWSTESVSRVDRHKLSEEGLHGRFSPDGTVFAAAQRDQIVLYDCNTGRATPFARYGDYIPNSRMGVTNVAFSSDGQSLAAGGEFKQLHTRVKLWDLSSAGRLESRSPLDHGPGRVVFDLGFSPNDRHLATIVRRGPTGETTVFLWDLAGESKARSD